MDKEKYLNEKNALRAAIAIGFSVCLGHFFKLNYAYWMLISVLVVIQPNVGATLLKARQRAFSTLFGVLIGALLLVLFKHNEPLVLITTFAFVFLCFWLMFLNYFWAIFFISAALIIAIGFHSNNSWEFVLNRLFDTVLGVVIGIAFSLILWPSWARLRLRSTLLNSMQQAKKLSHLVLRDMQKKETSLKEINDLKLGLRVSLSGMQQNFSETRYEVLWKSSRQIRTHAMMTCLERIKEILFAMHGMQHSQAGLKAKMINPETLEHFDKQFSTIFNCFIEKLENKNAHPETLKINLSGKTIPNPENCATILYLQRNLDRILFELKHLQQAFNLD
jgi:uncharacterized membrane protein YccC